MKSPDGKLFDGLMCAWALAMALVLGVGLSEGTAYQDGDLVVMPPSELCKSVERGSVLEAWCWLLGY